MPCVEVMWHMVYSLGAGVGRWAGGATQADVLPGLTGGGPEGPGEE